MEPDEERRPLAIQKYTGAPDGLLARLEAAEILRRSAFEERQRYYKTGRASQSAATSHRKALLALEAAKKRETELQSGRGSRLFRAVGVTIYEFWLELPGYAGPVREASARVEQHGDVHQVSDVTGKTKSGVGGAVVGGMLLGPIGAVAGLAATRKNTVKTTVRTVDTRQFELEIRGPGFAWSTTKGPNSAAELRKLRDLINARGSSTEDIRDAIMSHAHVLADRADTATQWESAVQSANGSATQQRQALVLAIEQYDSVRLPFLTYVKARWARSDSLHRVILVALAPIILTAWFVRHCVERLTLRK